MLLKVTCLVTLFDRKFQVSKKKSPNLTIFGTFNELLSTQNVNVARFARDVDDTFSVVFKHCANDIFGVPLFISHHLLQEISHRPFVYVKSYERRKFLTTFLQLLWLSEYRQKF